VTTLVDEMPSNVAPAWSPDGKHILYLSSRDEDNAHGPWRLWVMDADGGNQRPLPIDVPMEYGFGAEQVVSWGGAG
jgi:Tol biopolymer transport system component